MLICSSPQLFAACHVLLRRLMPRHPPYALSSLISRSPLCSRISVLYSRHLPKVFFFSSQIARKNVLFLSLSTISSFYLLDTSYLSRASLLYSLSSSLSLSLSSFSVVNVLLLPPPGGCRLFGTASLVYYKPSPNVKRFQKKNKTFFAGRANRAETRRKIRALARRILPVRLTFKRHRSIMKSWFRL